MNDSTNYFALACLLVRTEGATVLKRAVLKNMCDDEIDRLREDSRRERGEAHRRHCDDLATYGRRSS